ncbi:myosin-IIIb [Hyalella azteca]|uniref:non-specific serine/threonine protein kinase n=1 Tax=Hyalella azteca TaxID=294128 RepID=A0A8B7PKN4_HYAAZ|nr:myosin-IIIb [Hyalella azteca]
MVTAVQKASNRSPPPAAPAKAPKIPKPDYPEAGARMSYSGLSEHIDFDALPDPNTRFELLEVVGEGTYGEVFAAKDHDDGEIVAVKILENIAENLEEIEEEYLVLRDLSLHPNLPAFKGIFLKRGDRGEDDQAWVVLELCPRGSVTDVVQALLRRGQRLTEKQIAYILRETVHAITYLHENHCMHRDIKGHNILLTAHGHVKLVDFGVSSHLDSTWGRRNTSVGTPYWMAPEVIACEQQLDYSYDVRCDVWSLGITAIELADGEPPLSDIHPMRALFQIPRNPPPTLAKSTDWSPHFVDFVAECLVKDFEQRPSSRELLMHPFLKSIPSNPEDVRQELVQLSDDLRKRNQLVKKDPETTIKGGAIKADRRTKRTPLWMDDLASLEKLTPDSIVEHIQRRYGNDIIYTYMGDILIAVNPFKYMPIYGERESRLYRGMVKSENPPHIYAMADAAYHALLHHKTSQCIVISGESGAGKTESANLLLKQLVTLGKAPNRNLEEKILQVNPIMEAFGNAKTGINDNSSRFGKYLDLTYTRLGKVTGARVSVYLLEQSRVVHQAAGEQNFHIFYYLHDGLEYVDRLRVYSLDAGRRDKHRYLAGDSWSRQTAKNNVRQFQKVVEGFKSLGFNDDELDSIYRILAAIINLGDVDFYQTVDKDNMEQATVNNVDQVIVVSELLGVDATELTEALTSNSVVTRGEIITRYNTVDEAICTRDAMAKAMYGRLFDWIVNNVNRLLSFCRTVCSDQLAVGLLDIFGFENFEKNSFEQLCINIANEQLQYFFNQHIFTWEQQEYMAEGIQVDTIEFADNRPVLDMFLAKPLGLLALLDEESRFPQACNSSLTEKFHSNIRSKFYIRPKSTAPEFTIQHFAGKVTYEVKNFLDKNKNFLPTEVIHLLRQSSHEVIRFLFQCPLTKTGNLYYASPRGSPPASYNSSLSNSSNKFDSRGLASQTKAQQTVGTYFRYSLMDLLQKMVNGSPHFVRCIKPNDQKAKNSFDRDKVEQQLRYAGVMETVRIRQHGYSHRILFADFLRRYCFLAFNYDERVLATRDNCRLLLVRLKMDGWALGKTKVFLKYYHVEFLTKIYEKELRRIITVQACVRSWLARVRFQKLQRKQWALATSVLTLQKHVRGYLTRKRLNAAAAPAAASPPPEKTGKPQKSPKKGKENRKEKAPPPPENIQPAAGRPPRRAEEMTKEDAALVIQTRFRGFKVRQEWGPVLEERLRALVEAQDTAEEAERALKAEGLSPEEAAMVIQKFWGRHKRAKQEKNPHPNPTKRGSTPSTRMSDLIMFSEQVHVCNQDVHSALRRIKGGVEDIRAPPSDYKRPRGFQDVPEMLHEQRKRLAPQVGGGGRVNVRVTAMRDQQPSPGFTDLLQINSDEDLLPDVSPDTPWDAPLQRRQQPSRHNNKRVKQHVAPPVRSPAGGEAPRGDMFEEHKANLQHGALQSQRMLNEAREAQHLRQWPDAGPLKGVSPVDFRHDGPERGRSTPTTNLQAASELRQMLRTTQTPVSGSRVGPAAAGGADEELSGPFNFQQFLRRTNYAPTDTIRLRQKEREKRSSNGAF